LETKPAEWPEAALQEPAPAQLFTDNQAAARTANFDAC
jgi:hypothetical protein